MVNIVINTVVIIRLRAHGSICAVFRKEGDNLDAGIEIRGMTAVLSAHSMGIFPYAIFMFLHTSIISYCLLKDM